MSLTSNGLFHGQNRFGISKETLLAYSPDYTDPAKVDCYVPSRNDVFRMPMTTLVPILERWFTSAPLPLRPSPTQRREVLKLMRLRMDSDKIQAEIDAMAALANTG